MSSSDIIEIDDSDSELELIDMTSRSTSTSSSTRRSGDDDNKKRKRECVIEVISSDDDEDNEEIRTQLRELSVQEELVEAKEKQTETLRSSHRNTPSKRYRSHISINSSTCPPDHMQSHHPFRSQNATGYRPHLKSHLTWIVDTTDSPVERQSTYDVDGFEERCIKIYRKGFIHDDVEFIVDNAIVLPHRPPLYALIRSIFTLKFDDVSIKDKHFAHVHYIKSPNPHTDSSGRDGELFLRNAQCQDISIKQILKGQKLDFELVGGIKGKRRGSSKYFCQFVDQPSLSTIREPVFQDGFDRCDSCASRHQKHKFDDPRVLGDTLHFCDDGYHMHDFITVDPKIRGRPFLIGQIQGWSRVNGQLMVRMRRLKRFGEVIGAKYNGFVSNRRLVVTDKYEEHLVQSIMGKVYVLPKEEDAQYLDGHKAFWCSEGITNSHVSSTIAALQRPLRTCLSCLEVEKQKHQDVVNCIKACRFTAADYYSGAGGFILPGLDIFEWVSATDADKVACQTLHYLKREAPRMTVHYGRVREIYQYTTSRNSPTGPKAFPSPGTVFLMTGGPPCQGHSRVNHANNLSAGKNPDPRNDELWIMLAEVFRLRPYVVIIENVSAFKDDKGGDAGMQGEHNYGRAAMKELSQNGYSCRLGIVDSRGYGTPQNRLRTFILGVRMGLSLPEFPTPSHANPKTTATVFKTDKAESLKPFYLGQRATPGTGLHPAVTIRDAVSDFPAFEYLPPPGIPRIPRRPQIPVFEGGRDGQQGNRTRVGFAHQIPYASTPSNDYQKEKRGEATSVHDHHTSYVTDGAKKIIFASAREAKPQGCDRRAIGSEGFSTLLTNSSPGQKGTAVIHFSQDRKFTIAERKRAMGWPDWHRLAGSPLDQDRQTGNGVCFESVQAIYLELVKEIILPWWIEAGRPTEDVFGKFKIDHP
ncbi:hypothetical protein I204_03904 [Kwoniella mangroviensis CBS 8886]|nr:hypothetical protein I204_03904 [Kwoniella mangroviensis CBS 8886]